MKTFLKFGRLAALQARCPVGGQAVIEGVMMRSPKSFVVAVRRPDGRIVVREQRWETLWSGLRPLRWPFFRGAIVLIESLWNGLSALNFSAEQAAPEEERPSTSEPVPEGAEASQPTEEAAPRQATKQERLALAMTLVVSLAMGLALFVGAPHLLTWLLGEGTGLSLDTSGAAFHLVDGVFKVLIFVAYLLLISRMPDIQRVFEYHGAEHKSIWAYEREVPLTPESAASFSTLHPRCGTAFILIVLIVSIAIFAAVFPFVPAFSERAFLNQLCLIAVKLPLMLPIAGIAYELQRLSARPGCPRVVKGLVAPGMWLQRLTTKEPSADQLEIALVALRRALAHEEGALAPEGGAAGAPSVSLYPDFERAVALPSA